MRHCRFVITVLAAALLGAPAARAAAGTASKANALPAAVAAAFESVVGVRVKERETVPVFHGGRFQREEVDGIGAGSGVAISDDGLILTNAHVIASSTEVSVRLADGREVLARVEGVDEASDLALLRAPGTGLRPLAFAEGPLPPPGTGVFVLGNRQDLGPEVVWAKIGPHALARVGARPLEFWSEVEAPVGPGNSGGALLDANGRLLGVPSLLVSYVPDDASPVSRSAGLFIPAAHALRAVRRMTTRPSPPWPWIGLLLEDPLMAASEGRAWDGGGLRVRHVLPGSPAEAAGFRRGDRILSIGSRRPRDGFEALDAVLDLEPGQAARVTVERGGAALALEPVTEARPADPRPEALDDFALHTGIRLEVRPGSAEERPTLAFAGMSAQARREIPHFEAALFADGQNLGSLLPGQDLLAGDTRRLPITTPLDLSALLPRCFVEEQFVALVHWTQAGRQTVDRAYVHRKVYPVVL